MKSMDNRRRAKGDRDSAVLSSTAFGHVGAGGSIGFADPAEGLSFGYSMNQMGASILLNPRGQSLVDATYRALGYRDDLSGVWPQVTPASAGAAVSVEESWAEGPRVSDPNKQTAVSIAVPSARETDKIRRTPGLVVVHGAEIGKRHPLPAGGLVIGRDPLQVGLVLADPAVSARHCSVELDGDAARSASRTWAAATAPT